MSAQVITFPGRFVGVDLASGPDAMVRYQPAAPGRPYALVQHQGAVEFIAGCDDGDSVELWLTGEQAIALGEDLIRLGRMAQAEQEAAT